MHVIVNFKVTPVIMVEIYGWQLELFKIMWLIAVFPLDTTINNISSVWWLQWAKQKRPHFKENVKLSILNKCYAISKPLHQHTGIFILILNSCVKTLTHSKLKTFSKISFRNLVPTYVHVLTLLVLISSQFLKRFLNIFILVYTIWYKRPPYLGHQL